MSIAVDTTLAGRLRRLAEIGALRALGEQDRDPYSPTRGCFDRRYWAWKLVDYPEATFQRHVYPLALLYKDPSSRFYQRDDLLEAIADGVRFAASIQHRNGSFDQAFPFEQSWGATAFLLHPLLEAFELVKPAIGRDAERIAAGLATAGRFLCRHDERHGRITNHLAGGALSLYSAATRLNDAAFADRAGALVGDMLATQSPEGWFPEYGGADPGYQTLGLHYLAEIAQIAPGAALSGALDRTLEFLQWFVHPDGTFGGLYGSRRTRIAYLGGFALLAARSPLAAAMFQTLGSAAADGATVSVDTVDAGNLAPVLTSLMRAAVSAPPSLAAAQALPCERPHASCSFPQAGLYIRSATRYYAIAGSANGGTLAIFDRSSRTLVRDDGGYVGELEDGTLVTSQVTEAGAALNSAMVDAVDGNAMVDAVDGSAIVDAVDITTTFRRMTRLRPTPLLFLCLRLLNLTVMRSIAVGNVVKRQLVRRLMRPQAAVALRLERRIVFGERISVDDRIENPDGLVLRWLRGGRPFSSIHMASAGYYEGAAVGAQVSRGVEVDTARLARDKAITLSAQLP